MSATVSPKSSGSPAQPDALKQVMAELEEVGAIDPAAREELIADLKQTDPSRWPLVVQEFRAAAAYRRRVDSQSTQSAQLTPRDAGDVTPRDTGDGANVETRNQGKPAKRYDRDERLTDQNEHAAAPRPKASPLELVDNQTALSPEKAPAGVADTDSAKDRLPPEKPGEAMAIPTEPSPLSARLSASRDSNAPLPPGEGQGEGSSTVISATNLSLKPNALTLCPSTGGRGELAALTLDPLGKDGGPIAALTQADWQSHLAAAIHSMETASPTGSGSENDLALQARLRMLYLLAGRREDAMRPLPSAPKATQDYWSSQIYGLATWMDAEKTPDPARRAAEAKRILTEAVSQLGNTALLTVHNLTFCTAVQYYGSFDAVKSPEFTPGQKVLLYAEVENFRTEQSPKGFHTAVKFNWQIFDARGNRVGDYVSATSEETSLTPKHEFFLTKWFFLPSPMPAGKYTLQFTVEDVLGHKVGQSSIEMTIK